MTHDRNICLVGHRGTGKTSYLRRLAALDPSRAHVDLDEAIASSAHLTIAQIFAAEGEVGFRAREAKTLAALLAAPEPKVIAIGAGFPGPRPSPARVIWVRRETDRAGRAFLGRPRLDASVRPVDEYLARFDEREARYRAWADQVLTLPEGYDGGLEDFVGEDFRVPHDLTLPPAVDPATWWAARTGWRPRRIEVRDDLATPGTLQNIECLLRSCRRDGARADGRGDEDWALELGPPPRATTITSVHNGDVRAGVTRLAGHPGGVQKLAVMVDSFDDLAAGHRWWRDDPARRAFLPRSANGRWRWYRSLFGPAMPLHFVREDFGVADQPWLWQARLQPPCAGRFAAVLGQPVAHSRTPMEHRGYFAARQAPVVAIDVGEDEWDQALPVLIGLGLRWAAVTAPLKTRAFGACDEHDAAAARTGAVNTLHVAGDRIAGANTDLPALHAWRGELPDFTRPWLWGGGGTRPSVREVWPGVREVSARAGVDDHVGDAPDLLIWAVGRARAHRTPPAWVRPRLVLDLNYADDSPGLEFAVERGLPYQSGLRMFKLQAEAQRVFWDQRRDDRRARKSDR